MTTLREALEELVDLMQGVIDGNYKPDSFTLQPARAALAAEQPQPATADDMKVYKAIADGYFAPPFNEAECRKTCNVCWSGDSDGQWPCAKSKALPQAGWSDIVYDGGMDPRDKALAAEQEQAYTDLLTYGTSVMNDGKRIDPKTIYLKANQAQAGWKPIETAPKDMASRLYFVKGFVVQGFVDATGQLNSQNDRYQWQKMVAKPTHWMPLPQAPEAK